MYFSLSPSKYTLTTGILSFLLSSSVFISHSIFGVLVCIGFLALRVSLTLEEAILGAGVMTVGLKMIFFVKAEAEGYCMEFVLGLAIFSAAAWLIA